MAILNVGDYVKGVGDKWYMVILSPRVVFNGGRGICRSCCMYIDPYCSAFQFLRVNLRSNCSKTIGVNNAFIEVAYEEVQKSDRRKVEILKTGEVRDLA